MQRRGDVTCDDRVFRFSPQLRIAYQTLNTVAHSCLGVLACHETVRCWIGRDPNRALIGAAFFAVLVLYLMDVLLTFLPPPMKVHHALAVTMLALFLMEQWFLWDGVPMSKHDTVGWALSGGFLHAALRASVFEAVYFGLTLAFGPGWQHHGIRSRSLHCMLTLADDAVQGVSAIICGANMFNHQVYAGLKYGTPVLLFVHGTLLLYWSSKAVRRLLKLFCPYARKCS